MEQSRQSLVLETPAASPELINRYFTNKLAMETDASDVQHDLKAGTNDFLLADVRSSKAYEECRIPAAVHLPSSGIDAASTSHLSKEQVIVVYCWGPACNGAAKASAKLSALGFRVKEMLGGIEYWRREGYEVTGNNVQQAPLVG